jgi:hypothetical protein
VQWLHRHERPAERLCGAGVPTWLVHAEKGDGGLTDEEQSALEACPHAHLVSIPGSVFFLPNEVPRTGRRRHRRRRRPRGLTS